MASLTSVSDAFNRTIQRSIHTLNLDFFSSLGGDIDTLGNFLKSWASFDKSIHSCSAELQSDTAEMVYSLAATIDTVATGMLKLHSVSGDICSQFTTDVESILGNELKKMIISDDLGSLGTI